MCCKERGESTLQSMTILFEFYAIDAGLYLQVSNTIEADASAT
jgi:hypothetical protein